jgi:hypothetical protein
VYDADATIWGELSYWIGARLGRRHCSLCDITHGMFVERSDWQAARTTLAVPFATYHRNDMPDAVRSLGAALPAVFAETTDRTVLLLDHETVASCAASPERLIDAVNDALRAQEIPESDG